jgi:putative transposase
MPAKRPDYEPGHYYHFYNRGAHRLSIFREADNYLFTLRNTKTYCRTLSLTPIAYCLLPNHSHYLVRQDGEPPARLLPQRIFNSYTKAFNKRYGHTGTLFAGSYRVVPVERESYLLHLCRYIHSNPVIHGIVDDLENWPYSNYLEWIGERDGTLVDRDFVRAYFAKCQYYQQFVKDYLVSRRLPEAVKSLLGRLQG